MYKSLVNLTKKSAFYTFANAIDAASPFILALILTRQLSKSEYGVWILFISLVAFLRPLVNLSIQDALRMRFYEMDESERAHFVWSYFCLTTICTTGLAIITWMFSSLLSTALSLPPEWLVAIPLAAYLYAMFHFFLAYKQFAHDHWHFLILHVVQTVASLAFILYFVFEDWGWRGVAVGKMLGLALGCLVGLFWFLRSLDLYNAAKRTPELARMTRFGLMYLPTGLGLVIIPLTDRLIVTNVLGSAANGIYGVADLFGSAVFIVINGIMFAWMPWLFANLKQWSTNSREIVRVSAIMLILFPVGGVVASFMAAPIAPFLIGQEFAAAFPMIPWAIAGIVAMGYFFHNQAYLHYKKAVLQMSISSSICIILNAILSYYGAIHYGIAGVFAATIGAFLFAALVCLAYIIPRYQTEFSVD